MSYNVAFIRKKKCLKRVSLDTKRYCKDYPGVQYQCTFTLLHEVELLTVKSRVECFYSNTSHLHTHSRVTRLLHKPFHRLATMQCAETVRLSSSGYVKLTEPSTLNFPQKLYCLRGRLKIEREFPLLVCKHKTRSAQW